MKAVIASMIVTCTILACPALADDGEALLKKYNCMGCHKLEGKLMGPGFSDVAKKYKGDAAAMTKLSTVIAKGGSGVWGSVPMPAAPQVKPEEAKAMLEFILSKAQ